jgi:hypothetical protein
MSGASPASPRFPGAAWDVAPPPERQPRVPLTVRFDPDGEISVVAPEILDGSGEVFDPVATEAQVDDAVSRA